ncbi:EAL domain-containing protein [Shewanella sp. A3A]|nr:EAL domain-containing protein [Shewanella ferrihydritica]
MLFSDRIRTFILFFCVPALFAVAYGLHQWFEYRIDNQKTQTQALENQRIVNHFEADSRRLLLLAQLYATNVDDAQRQPLWQIPLVQRDVQVFHLQDNTLTPLGSDGPIDASLQQAILKLHSLGQYGFGASLLNQLPLAIGYQRLNDGHYIVVVRQLSAVYFNSLRQGELTDSIALEAANSAQLLGSAEQPISHVAVTSASGFPLMLAIQHQPDRYAAMAWHNTAMVLGLCIGGLLILWLGYLWLRRYLLAPFASLMQQIQTIDPTSAQMTSLNVGPQELHALSDSINSLLTGFSHHRARARITLAAIAEAVIVTDRQSVVTYMNPQAEKLLQIALSPERTTTIGNLLNIDNSLDAELQQFMASASQSIEHRKMRLQLEHTCVLDRALSNLRDPQGNVIGSVMVLRDITAEEKLKLELRRRANNDATTGLLNRHAFESQLPSYINHARSIAVCYLDLEQFKLINDNCGHVAGDRMLALVAKAMTSVIGKHGLLARLGGDEFGLVLRDFSAVAVARLLKKVSQQVAMQAVHHEGVHYRVGVSIGVAFYHGHQPETHELLKDADIACIAAKRKGSNKIHFYDQHDQQLSYERNAPKWAHRITQAIETRELMLYFQPIRSLNGVSKRQRLEILLRIKGEQGRVLPPAQFIAAAERFKLMPDVDKEVIRKAFEWLSQHREVIGTISLSINLSANSLGADGMMDYIADQQLMFDVPSSCICFEITETSAIQNRQKAMQMLDQLRKLGFSLALDDFGSGFASYGYLRELPVDYVKIDGCFVRQIATNARDFAIVKSIHDVCCTMGVETVAEFVESSEIIDKLNEIGINYAQGYAIGRPKPLEQYQHGLRVVGAQVSQLHGQAVNE